MQEHSRYPRLQSESRPDKQPAGQLKGPQMPAPRLISADNATLQPPQQPGRLKIRTGTWYAVLETGS